MIFKECSTLPVCNRVLEDPNRPFAESKIDDIAAADIRAVYPMIRALNSDRLTKNFTFYPKKSLVGKKEERNPTGYSSFVLPQGKPVLREHRLQDSGGLFGPSVQAEVPYGRVIFAGYKSRGKKESSTPPVNNLAPGTFEGSGYLVLVPIIANPEAVRNVLTGAFQTTSIMSNLDSVVESITKTDIVKAMKNGDELPPYERGQVYDVDGEKKLSYYIMGAIKGLEVSFVNNPSDELAGVVDPDIGEEGIRLLLGEKKTGSNEFSLYDAKSHEKVMTYEEEELLGLDEGCFEPSVVLIDSVKPEASDWFFFPGSSFAESTKTEKRETKKKDKEEKDEIDLINKIIDEVLNND